MGATCLSKRPAVHSEPARSGVIQVDGSEAPKSRKVIRPERAVGNPGRC